MPSVVAEPAQIAPEPGSDPSGAERSESDLDLAETRLLTASQQRNERPPFRASPRRGDDNVNANALLEGSAGRCARPGSKRRGTCRAGESRRFAPAEGCWNSAACVAQGVAPYRHARKNLQSASDLSMGEEVWATALAELAHSRFSVAMHELRVPAPGAEGDQARLNIDVTDR